MQLNRLDFKDIRSALKILQTATQAQKNTFLNALGFQLGCHKTEILQANKHDLAIARKANKNAAFLQRLRLTENCIVSMQSRLQILKDCSFDTAAVLEEKKLLNGALLKKVRSSFGVIAVIYEARPEVTIDTSALCIKSGNCAILKGGKEALLTNQVLVKCIREALSVAAFPADCITFIKTAQYNDIYWLIRQNKNIDLVIARGAYALVKEVTKRSKIPVLSHSQGGARIYVDQSADLNLALKVIVDAKISKPAACNSVDTIIIHRKIASIFVPAVAQTLTAAGVSLSGDRLCSKFAAVKRNAAWSEETLSLNVSIKIVKNAEEAVLFVNRYGKKHSEGIIAEDRNIINYFMQAVDAAAVFVNASTRLHDGFVFERGAEMGIATGKMHARGPVALAELCTYKWQMIGNGQIRG